MQKLYCIGDLHLSNNADYLFELSNRFLKWFNDYSGSLEKNTHELIVLGDVTEKDLLSGDIIELLVKFITICNDTFKKTYILIGNHDLRKYKNKLNYSASFVKHFNKIEIIEKERIFTTSNGFPILALPHQKLNNAFSLDDYYSTQLQDDFYNFKDGLICGHVAIKEEYMKYGGIDITKFNTNNEYAFGHIHTRNGINYDKYTGSVAPFKTDEEKTNHQRIIKCFSLTNNKVVHSKKDDIKIPIFIRFFEVQYPRKIENFDKDIINVFTVLNCKYLHTAKDFYNEYFVKDIKFYQKDVETKVNNVAINKLSNIDLIDLMMKEKGIVLKRSTMSYLKKLFL